MSLDVQDKSWTPCEEMHYRFEHETVLMTVVKNLIIK
jgi:hypothetical protein